MSKLFNIKAVLPQSELLGVHCDPQKFEDIVMTGWTLIGNKHTRLYRYVADTDEEGVLALPCNVDAVEAVTIPIVDAQVTTPTTNIINTDNIFKENYSEHFKKFKDPFYPGGKMVHYKEGNDALYFEHPLKHVQVLYHGYFADPDDGLPLINDKEMIALSYFVAYYAVMQESFEKRDGNLMKFAQTLQTEWLRRCNDARIPEHFSQNDMDAILDVKTRWDRKVYRKSFYPIP